MKQQREQRDREKMEKEQERELMQREEALIEAVELEKKEEEFPHAAQAKMRSDIRVREEGEGGGPGGAERRRGGGQRRVRPERAPARGVRELTTWSSKEAGDGRRRRARRPAAAHPAKRAFWDVIS